MKKLIKSFALIGLFAPAVQAIGIDSMLEFSDNNSASFTITNSADFRQYIYARVTELSVQDGELVKKRYTRDNIDEWTVSINPSRTILDPGMKKTFKAVFEPKPYMSENVDHAYQLSFIPTPYFSEEEKGQNAVKIATGFAPIAIFAAKKDQPLAYEIKRNGGKVVLKNNGKTYIRAFFDACPEDTLTEDRQHCTAINYALAGRELPITLGNGLKDAEQIKVELSTHSMDFKQDILLSKEQKLYSNGK